jgi:hypothetical protein
MKLNNLVLTGVAILSAFAIANPVDAETGAIDTSFNENYNIFEKRKGCTGQRKDSDECSGKKLQTQNSFHNW